MLAIFLCSSIALPGCQHIEPMVSVSMNTVSTFRLELRVVIAPLGSDDEKRVMRSLHQVVSGLGMLVDVDMKPCAKPAGSRS
jgi:hypothetical protein